MSHLDPSAAEAVRQALGLRPGDPDLADLAAAAAALNEATAATRLDSGAMVALAVHLVRSARARPGGPDVQTCHAALDGAWPVTSRGELHDLAALLLLFCACTMTDEQLALAAAEGEDLP